MNIKITKEEYDYLMNNLNIIDKYVMGSRLYGTNSEKSDTDILVLYENYFESDNYYPNYHQLQFDDIDNNIQYIFSSISQFYKNLFSGDSTINADIVMFSMNIDDKLNILRTFNIIKSYIGFAKRDIKMIGKAKNKKFHAERSLYSAEELLNNKIPSLNVIKTLGDTYTIDELKQKEEDLRSLCNKMFDDGILTMFPKIPIIKPLNDLEKKIIDSNNIREFRY